MGGPGSPRMSDDIELPDDGTLGPTGEIPPAADSADQPAAEPAFDWRLLTDGKGRKQPEGARKGIGGTFSHQPGCQCRPCAARQRQSETLAVAAGVGTLQVAPKTPNMSKARRPLRDRVAQFLHYSAMSPNATKADIAKQMGIGKSQLYEILRDAREEGLLTFTDPLDKLEYEVIPKAIDNLAYFLEKQDRTVTIEVAKGTIFKQFAAEKGALEAPQTILALKIETPDGENIKVATGMIVGAPKIQAEEED